MELCSTLYFSLIQSLIARDIGPQLLDLALDPMRVCTGLLFQRIAEKWQMTNVLQLSVTDIGEHYAHFGIHENGHESVPDSTC